MHGRMACRVMILKKISAIFSKEPWSGEVQRDPWVAGQPGADRRVLGDGVVVDH
jgi:hypothetical protein